MKKVNKSKILKMKLSSFGIKPLTNWVTREERRMESSLEFIRRLNKGLPEEEIEKTLQLQRDGYQKRIAEQPMTVGDLVRKFHYRFNPNSMKGRGLGIEPIEMLKVKLLDLGLTENDWPALLAHDQLLTYLSKRKIKELPLIEVFTHINFEYGPIYAYLGCGLKEAREKTIHDFLAINPLDVKDNEGLRFLTSHTAQLVALRQKLVTKGFTTRDGAFFKWDPEQKSLAKALERLRKYDLPAEAQLQFARIVVAERWVI